jgi:hypothetical protein
VRGHFHHGTIAQLLWDTAVYGFFHTTRASRFPLRQNW